MNKGTSFLPCLTLTLIAGSILLVAIIGFLGLVYLQNEVERTFGEAHPSIDYAQKLRLQLILFMNKDVLLKPLNPQGNVQSFVITANEPTQAILSRLSQEGLISNPKAMQALM
ncbi:MAG: hypothetical protein N3D16_00645, partial [Anaerolineales bacterium]|nr:hypothetical protein [Anaerolineales bacterium]